MNTAYYNLQIHETADGFCRASLNVVLSKGSSITLHAKVSIAAILKAIQRFRGRGVGYLGDEVGFNLFKSVRGIARSVAKSKVFKTARTVFRNPVFKGVAAAIPGVNAAVGALTAADLAMQAAAPVARAIAGGGRKSVKKARAQALQIKKVAARQARDRGVPFEEFSKAWVSGWGAVPDPRLVNMVKRSPESRDLFAKFLPTLTRGYQSALPNLFAQAF